MLGGGPLCLAQVVVEENKKLPERWISNSPPPSTYTNNIYYYKLLGKNEKSNEGAIWKCLQEEEQDIFSITFLFRQNGSPRATRSGKNTSGLPFWNTYNLNCIGSQCNTRRRFSYANRLLEKIILFFQVLFFDLFIPTFQALMALESENQQKTQM